MKNLFSPFFTEKEAISLEPTAALPASTNVIFPRYSPGGMRVLPTLISAGSSLQCLGIKLSCLHRQFFRAFERVGPDIFCRCDGPGQTVLWTYCPKIRRDTATGYQHGWNSAMRTDYFFKNRWRIIRPVCRNRPVWFRSLANNIRIG